MIGITWININQNVIIIKYSIFLADLYDEKIVLVTLYQKFKTLNNNANLLKTVICPVVGEFKGRHSFSSAARTE